MGWVVCELLSIQKKWAKGYDLNLTDYYYVEYHFIIVNRILVIKGSRK